MTRFLSILTLITFAWISTIQAFPYADANQDIFPASKLGTGANALFGEKTDLKNAVINAAVSAVGAYASTNAGVISIDANLPDMAEIVMNSGIGAVSGIVIGKNGDAALVGAAGGAIGSAIGKMQEANINGSSNAPSYTDRVRDAFRKSLPQLAAVTATMFMGLGDYAAIASQTAATTYEGAQGARAHIQRREEIRAYEAQLQQEALNRVRETEARENAEREQEEKRKVACEKEQGQKKEEGEKAKQKEQANERRAEQQRIAHQKAKNTRHDNEELTELIDIEHERSLLTSLESEFGAFGIDALAHTINTPDTLSGRMSPTSQAFYTEMKAAQACMNQAEQQGNTKVYAEAKGNYDTWRDSYDERQYNRQGIYATAGMAHDVATDLRQNWKNYGLSVAESMPAGIGTSVSVGREGYAVYQGKQTALGATAVLASEMAMGYFGGKVIGLVSKAAKHVGQVCLKRVPKPANLNAANSTYLFEGGSKTNANHSLKQGHAFDLKTSHQKPMTLEESAHIAKANAERAQLEMASKKLLPGEGKVDTYGILKSKHSLPGDDLSAHHIPHAQYMKTHGIDKSEGISMMVQDPVPGTKGRHREIHKALKKQDPSLKPRQALAQGIDHSRAAYQKDGVYTQKIRESHQTVIDFNKRKYPELFTKKVSES